MELSQKGDWIIGTGGQSKKSCGNGRVVYIMRVDDKIPFRDYLRDARFHGRADRKDRGGGNKYALISKTFFYFGRKPIPVSDIPAANLDHPIEKKGPWFRKDFPESFIRQFAAWVQGNYEVGMHGEPCAPASKERIHKCGTLRKASVCRSTSRVPHVAGANRILLLRVGMDLGYGGLGPLFPNGRFEYVPIPENPKKRLLAPSSFPKSLHGLAEHLTDSHRCDIEAAMRITTQSLRRLRMETQAETNGGNCYTWHATTFWFSTRVCGRVRSGGVLVST